LTIERIAVPALLASVAVDKDGKEQPLVKIAYKRKK
jgi:hypothetical protein